MLSRKCFETDCEYKRVCFAINNKEIAQCERLISKLKFLLLIPRRRVCQKSMALKIVATTILISCLNLQFLFFRQFYFKLYA